MILRAASAVLGAKCHCVRAQTHRIPSMNPVRIVALVLALTFGTAAVSAAAGAGGTGEQGSSASVPVPSAPPLAFRAGLTVWTPQTAVPGRCLRLQHRGGAELTLCLLKSGKVAVRHSGIVRRSVVTTKNLGDGSLQLRSADLMVRPGMTRVSSFCKGGVECDEIAEADLRVPRLRIAGCSAKGPQLIERIPSKRKTVALTIDGGPSTFTPAVLRTLRKFHVPATFFVVGQRVAAFPELVRRASRQGHEIANHSYSHPHVGRIGPDSVERDLSRASLLIRKYAGYSPCSFRAPYLEQTQRVREVAWSLGMATVGAEVDPVDWASPGVETITNRVVAGARSGSVLLMHDGGGPREQSVQAFPHLVRQLLDRGYRFVTLAELADFDVRYR